MAEWRSTEKKRLRVGNAGMMRGVSAPNRAAARTLALAASSSRLFGGALVARDSIRRAELAAISSIACRKAASFVWEGFVKPLILRTYCREAARISSSVTGGSKLKSGLILRPLMAIVPAWFSY